MTRIRATAIGFCAVLLWSLLAALTVASTPTPPLLLNTLCFAIGGGVGLVWLAATGRWRQLRGVSPGIYAFGIMGLFGYHALYFSALRLAPPAEAGLIAYLWPLLIVLFSGLLPGERLRRGHLAGAVLGLAGAALIILQGRAGMAGQGAWTGLGLAFLCALTWSGYSVMSRRLSAAPTASVAVFCVGTALLSAPLHLALEQTVWPDPAGWLAVIALGLGPVGAAFFLWDVGVKQGDIQVLGTSSYAAPLMSTLLLVGLGLSAPSWTLAVSAVLITGGAALAAHASMRA